MTDDVTPWVTVIVVQRGTLAEAQEGYPDVTGWTTCRCGEGVLLRGHEAAQVTAGKWHVLCQECAVQLHAEHPEAFDNLVYRPGRTDRPSVN